MSESKEVVSGVTSCMNTHRSPGVIIYSILWA